MEFFLLEDGTVRARSPHVDIAIDLDFEPDDALRATMFAASQPLVLDAPPMPSSVPSSVPPPMSLRETAPVAPLAVPETRRTAVWPVVLCGFIAVVCATIAFLRSPLAQHPSVSPYARAVMERI